MIEELDRFKGALLGLAVGDAVGTTVEFMAPGTFTPVTDMVGGGPFDLPAGAWTDDTSLALCLAASLIEFGFQPADQLRRYVFWRERGYMSSIGHCFDIGISTSIALDNFLMTNDEYCGSTDEYSAGNGSLMRLAPVAMYYHYDAEAALEKLGNSSRTTHGAEACVDACKYFGELLIAALHGVDKETILEPLYSNTSGAWYWGAGMHNLIYEVAKGSYKTKQPPEIKGSGYVVKSLEAALWAFYTTDNFKDAILAAVNLGDDADTTAAIVGQIAGAYYGVQDIPAEWLEKLYHKDVIENLAVQLYEKAPA